MQETSPRPIDCGGRCADKMEPETLLSSAEIEEFWVEADVDKCFCNALEPGADDAIEVATMAQRRCS